MAVAMFFGGVELLVWDNGLTFGAFRQLLLVMTQQEIGVSMVFVGWLRISSLMLNGQLILDLKVGPVVRSICAVVAAAFWVQFALALLQISVEQGYPSLGIPFWTMFTISELYVAYSVGTEWKK